MTLAPGADGLHPTFCRLCEAQCGLIAEVAGGRITNVGPDRAHPISSGHLCVKGPAMQHITYDEDRVLLPLKRTGGPGEFTPVSWDEAIDDIASRLSRITADHGGDSLSMYVGNPAAFATLHYAYAGGFAAAFGSAKLIGVLHIDTAAKQLACELIFGSPTRPTFPDLERCDFLLILGANPMVSHLSMICEPRALHKLEAIAKRGGVVVIDPRRTETAKRFEHVPILPDSDAWLLGGMLHVIFTEGLFDEAYLDASVDGWRSLRETMLAWSLETSAAKSTVPVGTIQALARRFASSRTAACYGRVGTNRGSFSTITNVFIEALNLVTGRFGMAGGWVIGSNTFGNHPLPAEARYGARRSRIGNIPLILGANVGGELAEDILTPGSGRTRALFVDSGNPVSSYPNGRRLAEALETLELFVGLDLYVTETTRHAHYILPTTTFFERPDVNEMWSANAPRPWIQYTAPVIPPIGEARHEYAIYGDILERAGRPATFASPTGEPLPFDEVLASLFAARSDGVTLDMMREQHPHGLQLAENVDAGASWSLISHPDQRPKLWHQVISEEIGRLKGSAFVHDDGKLKLFGRRKLRSMNSWMHNDMRIVKSDSPTLLIHPQDALERQISDGQAVSVSSKSGTVMVRAELSMDVVRGSVSYPHGWGNAGGWRVASSLEGTNINVLASSNPADWEQVSGACLVDGIPVEVSAAQISPDEVGASQGSQAHAGGTLVLPAGRGGETGTQAHSSAS